MRRPPPNETRHAPVSLPLSLLVTGDTLDIVAGMPPVAIGAGEGQDFNAPLGRAVIGGVITSTLLTLLVIPTVYETMDGWRSWVLARLGRGGQPAHDGRGGHGGAPVATAHMRGE